jgi:hypothetical protein
VSAGGTALALPVNDVTITSVRDRALVIRDTTRALVIDSDERKRTAADVLARIAAVQREAEARRTELVKPHNDHVKAINNLFREILAPVVEADAELRRRLLDFDREQRRRAAKAAAAAEHERLASAALLKEAEKAEAAGQGTVAAELLDQAVASDEAVKVAATQAIAPPTTVRAESGSTTVQKRWAFRLVDLAQVPLEYLALNETKVRDAIRIGVRIIPGLQVYQDDVLQVRR